MEEGKGSCQGEAKKTRTRVVDVDVLIALAAKKLPYELLKEIYDYYNQDRRLLNIRKLKVSVIREIVPVLELPLAWNSIRNEVLKPLIMTIARLCDQVAEEIDSWKSFRNEHADVVINFRRSLATTLDEIVYDNSGIQYTTDQHRLLFSNTMALAKLVYHLFGRYNGIYSETCDELTAIRFALGDKIQCISVENGHLLAAFRIIHAVDTANPQEGARSN